jgi:hypothetical protein
MKTAVQLVYQHARLTGATVAKIAKTYALVITADGRFIMVRFFGNTMEPQKTQVFKTLELALATCAAIDMVETVIAIPEYA